MKKKILFICTGNSCRSQIAEGFLKHIAGSVFEASSAGTNPSLINPYAIEVMNEKGIDISKQRSNPLQEFIDDKFDFIITVCDNAKASCPVFPGKCKLIHWNLEDPAKIRGNGKERLAAFRLTRDEIERRVGNLIRESS